MLRFLVAGVVALGLGLSAAKADDGTWLIGTWKGELVPNGCLNDSPGRTLNIKSVQPDGTVINLRGGKEESMTWKDGELTFSWSGNNRYVLRRNAAANLAGQLNRGGDTRRCPTAHSIEFKK